MESFYKKSFECIHRVHVYSTHTDLLYINEFKQLVLSKKFHSILSNIKKPNLTIDYLLNLTNIKSINIFFGMIITVILLLDDGRIISLSKKNIEFISPHSDNKVIEIQIIVYQINKSIMYLHYEDSSLHAHSNLYMEDSTIYTNVLGFACMYSTLSIQTTEFIETYKYSKGAFNLVYSIPNISIRKATISTNSLFVLYDDLKLEFYGKTAKTVKKLNKELNKALSLVGSDKIQGIDMWEDCYAIIMIDSVIVWGCNFCYKMVSRLELKKLNISNGKSNGKSNGYSDEDIIEPYLVKDAIDVCLGSNHASFTYHDKSIVKGMGLIDMDVINFQEYLDCYTYITPDNIIHFIKFGEIIVNEHNEIDLNKSQYHINFTDRIYVERFESYI